jgi:hypothetical protein
MGIPSPETIDVHQAANEGWTARTAEIIDNGQENGTSSAHLSLEVDVSPSRGTDLPETVALGEPVHTRALSIKAHRAPQKCSGCGSFGHNYRNCPEK